MKPLALLACLLLAGCVSTGFDFETSKTDEAGYTDTYTDPLTKVSHVVVHQPRLSTTKRRGSYLNNQALGQAAGGALQDFGGLDGILGQIGTGGWLGIGTGVLGLLGIGAKTVHVIGKQSGKDIGWEERERAGTIQSPLPQIDSGQGTAAPKPAATGTST